MTTTLAVLRPLVAQKSGDHIYGSTTSAGNGGGTTYLDTALADRVDDTYNAFYSIITSGTYLDQHRLNSDFAQSTGTVTVGAAFGGQIASAVSYELHRFKPEWYVESLNEAIRALEPWLFQELRDETLIADNMLPNGNFEDWTSSSAPDYWTLTTATAATNTTAGNFKYGKSAMALTGGASSGYAACSQANWLPLLDAQNHTITFTAWVKTSTASHCRIAIVDDDGTTYSTTSHSATSGYHTGDGTWQFMVAQRTIKAESKVVSFRVYADVNATVAYVDQAVAYGASVRALVLPLDFQLKEPFQILRQLSGGSYSTTYMCMVDDEGDVGSWMMLFPNKDYEIDYAVGGPRMLRLAYSGGRYKLRLIGTKALSTFTTSATAKAGTGTATTEIDSPRTELLATYAAACLMRKVAMSGAGEESGRYEAKAAQLFASAEVLKWTHRMIKPAKFMPRM